MPVSRRRKRNDNTENSNKRTRSCNSLSRKIVRLITKVCGHRKSHVIKHRCPLYMLVVGGRLRPCFFCCLQCDDLFLRARHVRIGGGCNLLYVWTSLFLLLGLRDIVLGNVGAVWTPCRPMSSVLDSSAERCDEACGQPTNTSGNSLCVACERWMCTISQSNKHHHAFRVESCVREDAEVIFPMMTFMFFLDES